MLRASLSGTSGSLHESSLYKGSHLISDKANSNVAFSFAPILFTDIRVKLPVSYFSLHESFSSRLLKAIPNVAGNSTPCASIASILPLYRETFNAKIVVVHVVFKPCFCHTLLWRHRELLRSLVVRLTSLHLLTWHLSLISWTDPIHYVVLSCAQCMARNASGPKSPLPFSKHRGILNYCFSEKTKDNGPQKAVQR